QVPARLAGHQRTVHEQPRRRTHGPSLADPGRCRPAGGGWLSWAARAERGGGMWDEAGWLAEWLGDMPVEAQLLKLLEEVGEVAEAYLGITGAVALVILAGGPDEARAAFAAHLAGVVTRTGAGEGR